jgi:initiation factor 1A
MPKNFTGGKNFKKGRKLPTEGGTEDKRFNGLEEGQDLGRVTKMLGNRRVLCFCGNDGIERVSKIRGVLCKGPKKQRIEVGDIVLISSRDFSGGADDSSDEDGAKKVEATAKPSDGGAVTASGKRDVYDIITKLANSQIRDARKNQKGLHKMLFELSGEHRGGVNTAFEFGYESDDGKPDSKSEEEDSRVAKRDKIRHRGGGARGDADGDGGDAMPTAPAAADSEDEDADVDVDAI